MCPQRVPQGNQKMGALKRMSSLKGAELSRKKMLQASEGWLMAENGKSHPVEKGKVKRNEHLLCIYYMQALGRIMT